MAVAGPESFLTLLRADLRVAWDSDRLPVVVLAVMVTAVVLLVGGLGWWLLFGPRPV
jgi:hypothetical protein